MNNRAALQNISIILSLISAAIGFLVLLGWQLDNAVLKSLIPDQITMKVNTAVCMIICGCSIAILPKRFLPFYKCLAIGASIIVLLIAVFTLYQYIFDRNIGIDQLIVHDKKSIINPGRMSPTTAFCFFSISISILLSAQTVNFRFKKILIGAFSATVSIIAVSIFLSYIPNVLWDYHIFISASMGIHTSLAFVFLSMSLLLLLSSEKNLEWTLSPFISFVCIVGLFSFLWMADAYNNSTKEIKKNEEMIIQLHEVLKELNIIGINLNILESNEYRYLLTKDKKLLENKNRYKNAIEMAMKKIDKTGSELLPQKTQLSELKALIKKRLDFSNISTLKQEAILSGDIYNSLNQFLNNVDLILMSHTKKIKTTVHQKSLTSPLSIFSILTLLSIAMFIINASSRDRKKMESINNKIAAIVDSSDDAIISKDLNGNVTSWNSGAEQIFGYSAKEMIGKPISILFPPDRINEEPEILKRITKGEKIDHFETVRKRRDGKLINVSVTISPIKDAHNKIVGASKIVRDITDSKRLERQLRQSQKMGAIGQLSGGIAHDFNNLLGIIIGNLDLLERSILDNETALKRTQTALKAATRGAELTKRLLAFSRQQPLTPQPSDINHSIHNLVEMASQILGNNIKITLDIDSNLPSVLVDVAELESALLNLAVNARDAMPNGGKLIISTKLRELDDKYTNVQTNEIPAGKYAAISVTDTGHGIPAEILEHVYEPFFTTKERGKGTGMGLSMVYGFAKQSGGAVKMYSEVDHGTTVTIYLPLATNIPETQKNILQTQQAILSGKVLVVDDEPDLLEIASLYLKEMGFEVFQAENSQNAIETFERVPDITLLITDIVMPGEMNGVELAKRVRKLKNDIIVIYVSGFPLGKFSENESTKIDSHFLTKPYQHDEFINSIRHIINNPNYNGKV